MSYTSNDPQFRSLNDQEEQEFRQDARDNDPEPRPWGWALYHPVCREEWLARGLVPYDLLMQASEDKAEAPCGCRMERCLELYGDNSIAFTYCEAHKVVNT